MDCGGPPTLDYATPAARPTPRVSLLGTAATLVAIPLAVVLVAPAFGPAWGYAANNPTVAILATAGGLFYVWCRLWRGPDGPALALVQGIFATVAVCAVAAQVVALKNDPGHPLPRLRPEVFEAGMVAAATTLLFAVTRLASRLIRRPVGAAAAGHAIARAASSTNAAVGGA